MKKNKLYADMFLNDYSLGQSVPREIFYYFDEKWTVVDNSKGKCKIIPLESEEACMAYSRTADGIYNLISELNYLINLRRSNG